MRLPPAVSQQTFGSSQDDAVVRLGATAPEVAQPSSHIDGSRARPARLSNHHNTSAAFCPGCVTADGDSQGRDGSRGPEGAEFD
jgi:hypothetical protein